MEYEEDLIQALSSRDTLRKRPQFYFEHCFKDGNLNSWPFEVICHALDEYFDGQCNFIKIELFKDAFSVTYNAAMSLERYEDGSTKAEAILSKIFTCKNEKKHLKVGDEFCKIGIASLNFASDCFAMETLWQNQKGKLIFEKGLLEFQSIETIETELAPYTYIFVRPDESLFPGLGFDLEGIKARAKTLEQRLEGLSIIC